MRHVGLMVLWTLLLCGAARAQGTYVLDPQHARIGFSVSHMGLFTTEGNFRNFDSEVSIDPAAPAHTRINVWIDASSAALTSKEGEEMLRSPAYFDVAHYPDIRFVSTAVEPKSATDYAIRGELRMRGVTRPLTLEARLVNHQRDPASGVETVDFVVTGNVRRSAFGMVADTSFVADDIALNIMARLLLPEAPHAP